MSFMYLYEYIASRMHLINSKQTCLKVKNHFLFKIDFCQIPDMLIIVFFSVQCNIYSIFKTNTMLTLIPHNSQSDLFLLDCYGTDVCKYAVYLSYFVNILLRIVNLIYVPHVPLY